MKVLDNQRLKSIKTRLNSYAAQINESSRTLSPQVCICAFKLFRHTTIILPLVSSCFLHTYSFFPTKGARRITVIGGKENWRRGKRIVVNNNHRSWQKKEKKKSFTLVSMRIIMLSLCKSFRARFQQAKHETHNWIVVIVASLWMK